MRKVLKDSKTLLFENMAKLNPDFKMKTVLNENPVDEISTGLAQKASSAAINKWGTSSGDDITARKRSYQDAKFSQYINPELKNFLMRQFADVPNFEVFKEGDTIILKFPFTDKTQHPTLLLIAVNIKSDKYSVTKGIENQFGRIEYESGGESYLPSNVLSRLPNIIKRVQADMRGEKSMYNPTKPIPQPEPQPEPIATPTPAEKPKGFMGNLKDKFKFNEDSTGIKYRAEVTGKGENVWSTNAMEYDTEEEAKEWLKGLAGRWFGYDMSRVVPTSVPKAQPVDLENDVIFQNFRG